MKIILTQPNIENVQVGCSLALHCLASYLIKENFCVRVIDGFHLQLSNERLLEEIGRFSPELVGVSLNFQVTAHKALDFIRLLRLQERNIPVVVGGHFATAESRNILRNIRQIDYVVEGEGEVALSRLARALDNNLSLATVPNLTYRSPSGRIITNARIDLITPLDNLPHPNLEDITCNTSRKKRCPIQASRGCYAKCTFCSVRHVYKSAKRRLHSPEYVVREIEMRANQYGIRRFWFCDALFLDRSPRSLAWVTEFSNRLIKAGLDIDFTIEVRANDVQETPLLRLREAGLSEIFIGAENANNSSLQRMKKHLTQAKILWAIQTVQRAAIPRYFLGFIMYDPQTTMAEIEANLKFLAKNPFVKVMALFSRMEAYSGTEFRQRLIENDNLTIEDFCDVGNWKFEVSEVDDFYHSSKEIIGEPLIRLRRLILDQLAEHEPQYLDKMCYHFERRLTAKGVEFAMDLFEAGTISPSASAIKDLHTFMGVFAEELNREIQSMDFGGCAI